MNGRSRVAFCLPAVVALVLTGPLAYGAVRKGDQKAEVCPLGVAGADLSVQDAPDGLDLFLVTDPGKVQALRKKVTQVAARVRSQNATAVAIGTMGQSMAGPMVGDVMSHMMWRMEEQRDWRPTPIAAPESTMDAEDVAQGMLDGGVSGAWDAVESDAARREDELANSEVAWSRIETNDVPHGVEVRLIQSDPAERRVLSSAVHRRADQLASAAACRLSKLVGPIGPGEP